MCLSASRRETIIFIFIIIVIIITTIIISANREKLLTRTISTRPLVSRLIKCFVNN